MDDKPSEISRTRLFPSEENILAKRVSEIDTWPFLPIGVISTDRNPPSFADTGRIEREREQEFSKIDDVLKKIYVRQIIAVSFILAMAIGILGNFIVSLLFAPLNLQLSQEAQVYSATSLLVIGILSYIVVRFITTRLNYEVRFRPPWVYPSLSLPEMQEDKLELKARMHTSFGSSFLEIIVKFALLISAAILRDTLKSMKWKAIKVSELIRLENVPFYIITLDFRRMWFFWLPSVRDKVRIELMNLSMLLEQAKISIAVYAVDQDEERWLKRGHLFLNEVSKWDMSYVLGTIEGQIKAC